MAKEQDSEKTYEVRDKRRVNPDGTLKQDQEEAESQGPAEEGGVQNPAEEVQAEAAAEQAAAEAPGEQPGAGRAEREEEQEPMPPPNVYSMLEFIMGLLSEQAWQLMGVRLAPGQKELVKDMAQAKLAIDTVVFISDKLHPHLSEDDRKSIRSLISDLQMNFVMHSQ